MLIKTWTGRCLYSDTVGGVGEVLALVRAREGLGPEVELRCEADGRVLAADTQLLAASVTVLLAAPLPGGKGGFGSLLRSIGAQIEKTTNHEAMRDLSGRRQRDVNNEERLKKYVAGAAEREREAREKREEKLEKLRRLAEGENKDKRGFSDPVYDKVRSETEEKVHDAVEAAMAAASSAGSSNNSAVVSPTPNNNLKRKVEAAQCEIVKKKPKGLWLGEGLDDLEDSDLTDSDDDQQVKAN